MNKEFGWAGGLHLSQLVRNSSTRRTLDSQDGSHPSLPSTVVHSNQYTPLCQLYLLYLQYPMGITHDTYMHAITAKPTNPKETHNI